MTARPSEPAEQSVRELTRRIGQRRWLLLAVFLVVFAAVALWAFIATPRYRSAARLRIESRTQTGGIGDQVAGSLPGAGLLGLGRDELETEVGVLRSDRVSDAMIDSLALGVRVSKPPASRARILEARVVDPTIDVDGRLTLIREGGGHYRVEEKNIDDATVAPPAFMPGTPVRVGGTLITLSSKLIAAGPDKIVIKLLPRYKVHELLERRLLIERQEGGSRLVEVSFEDADRVLAAQVVNRVLSEFVTYTTANDRTEDTSVVGQLANQVDSTHRKLIVAESMLRTFEERNKLIVPEEQATAQIKRISLISTRVDAVSVERNALARMLAIIDTRSKGGSDAAAYRQLATFPSLITNKAIQDLLAVLGDLENKRSALGVRRTESNAEYKQFTDRIGEIERQLYALGSQYLESLDQELTTTAGAVTALTDTLQAMPAAAMQYGRLLRDRTVLETVYLALQKQLKQAELKDVLRQQRIRVVDVPRVANPDDPVFPKKNVMLLLGAVLGIVLALTAGLVLELWREPASGV
jgi:uncharacterized protein involved in exopolysaccharide biosynthesis